MANGFLPPGYAAVAEQLALFRSQYSAQMEGIARMVETVRASERAVSELEEQLTKAGEEVRASVAYTTEAFRSAAQFGASIGNPAKRYASVYQDVAASLVRALEVPQLFQAFQFPVFEIPDAQHARISKAACKLADAGWAFFWDAAPSDVVALAEADLSPSALDDEIVGYYEHEEGAELKALAKRLMESPRLATWRPWLSEALWAYEQQKYRVAIPSLFSMIEGLVYETAGTLSDRTTKPAVQWQLKATKPSERGFFVDVGWRVVTTVLGALWRKHYFDEPAPDGVNRHRVLHGRSPEVGGKADALRLMVALDCIAVTVEHTEEHLKARAAMAKEDPAA
jgi:hypothetical protein